MARQVLRRTGREVVEHRTFRDAASEPRRERIPEIALGGPTTLLERQLFGGPQRPPGRQDRHLRHRIGVVGRRSHQRVAGLVHGDAVLLLLSEQIGVLAFPDDETIASSVEVVLSDLVTVVPDSGDRRLVHEVLEPRPLKPGVARATRPHRPRRGRRRQHREAGGVDRESGLHS